MLYVPRQLVLTRSAVCRLSLASLEHFAHTLMLNKFEFVPSWPRDCEMYAATSAPLLPPVSNPRLLLLNVDIPNLFLSLFQ